MGEQVRFALKVVLVMAALVIIGIATTRHNVMVADKESYHEGQVAQITASRDYYRDEMELYKELWEWSEDILLRRAREENNAKNNASN